MATMTVSLPEPMKTWIEELAGMGEYASTSDYIRDLVRRDRERRNQDLSIEELRQIVVDARASGVSKNGPDLIFARAKEIVRAKGAKGA